MKLKDKLHLSDKTEANINSLLIEQEQLHKDLLTLQNIIDARQLEIETSYIQSIGSYTDLGKNEAERNRRLGYILTQDEDYQQMIIELCEMKGRLPTIKVEIEMYLRRMSIIARGDE